MSLTPSDLRRLGPHRTALAFLRTLRADAETLRGAVEAYRRQHLGGCCCEECGFFDGEPVGQNDDLSADLTAADVQLRHLVGSLDRHLARGEAAKAHYAAMARELAGGRKGATA